jgi:hypothetical protein
VLGGNESAVSLFEIMPALCDGPGNAGGGGDDAKGNIGVPVELPPEWTLRLMAIDPWMVDPTALTEALSFPSPPPSDQELAELVVFPRERMPVVDDEMTLSYVVVDICDEVLTPRFDCCCSRPPRGVGGDGIGVGNVGEPLARNGGGATVAGCTV